MTGNPEPPGGSLKSTLSDPFVETRKRSVRKMMRKARASERASMYVILRLEVGSEQRREFSRQEREFA